MVTGGSLKLTRTNSRFAWSQFSDQKSKFLAENHQFLTNATVKLTENSRQVMASKTRSFKNHFFRVPLTKNSIIFKKFRNRKMKLTVVPLAQKYDYDIQWFSKSTKNLQNRQMTRVSLTKSFFIWLWHP